MHSLIVNDLAKRFGPRKVFSAISFELATGEAMAVVGPNGSGKSTLLLVLLSLHRPTRGSALFCEDGRPLAADPLRSRISFVAPYLTLYDYLSAEENLKFFAAVSGGNLAGREIDGLLARVGLEGRGHDLVAAYSSGMKQRLKYALALSRRPAFLFLDEPTANLDDAGKKIVFGIIEECRAQSVVLIATNEREEYALAARQCRLGQ